LSKTYPLRIDIFAHIIPQKSKEAFKGLVPNHELKFILASVSTLWDIEHRLRIMDKHPNLKFITHHGGAMVPFFEERIIAFHDDSEMALKAKHRLELTKAPIEYFKSFYADTANYGHPEALMLARNFFGTDHLLFGTDMPFARHYGERVTRQTIAAIEEMNISDTERRRIFEDNSRKIMRLPL
jgi:uncharacterized protein